MAERLSEQLRTPAVRQLEAVEAGYGHAVAALVGVITAMQTGIAGLEVAMTAEFEQHAAAELLRSIPGLGPILAARVLAEVGDDPTRFGTAQGLRAFAGTAPITKASGKSKVVRTRHVRNRRLADACHWWAFAAITKSASARSHYDRRRAAGDSHNAALRNLANKLLGRLWWCLANDQPWDEQAAWPPRASAPVLTAA
jgi:transposase